MLRRQSVAWLWLCFLSPAVVRAVVAVRVVGVVTGATRMNTVIHAKPTHVVIVVHTGVHVIIIVISVQPSS